MKQITIDISPERLQQLKDEAAQEGKTLNDYVVGLLLPPELVKALEDFQKAVADYKAKRRRHTLPAKSLAEDESAAPADSDK